MLFLFWGNTRLIFEVGAMPNLKALTLSIEQHNCKFAGGGGDFEDIGIHHLSSLASVDVLLDCSGSKAADVEAMEASFKTMANAHPNRPSFIMERRSADRMLQYDD